MTVTATVTVAVTATVTVAGAVMVTVTVTVTVTVSEALRDVLAGSREYRSTVTITVTKKSVKKTKPSLTVYCSWGSGAGVAVLLACWAAPPVACRP